MSVASILTASISLGSAEPRDSISQYGITWRFDEPARCGPFVTGDWWVVGPVTLRSVDPAPAAGRNGSVVNPPAGEKQGYDDRMAGFEASLVATFPLRLEPGQSLVSTASVETVGVRTPDTVEGQYCRGPLRTAAVLTCVKEPPAEDAFRPAYVGTWKQAFTASTLRRDLLPDLAIPEGLKLPDIGRYERSLERIWLDHQREWVNRMMHPLENMPDYGREITNIVSDVGLLLDCEPMMRVKATFQEDQQTYYGKGYNGERALWSISLGNPNARHEEVDPAKWESFGDTRGNNGTKAEAYRKLNGPTWVGQALAARILGLIDAWDHPAFFDYVDRWCRAEETPANPFVSAMWNSFRRGADPNARGKGRDLLRFLENSGNSVYEAEGLLRRWPPEGPKKLWTAQIGFGKSAVVEAGGRAFTATETDDKQYAIALDPGSGRTLWKQLLLAKRNRHYEKGPVTSPVVDGDRVYYIPYAILGSDVWEMRCPIVCLKTDGTELWRADQTFWGTEASTPLVEGDTLYVGADNPEHVVLVALDKMTGKLRWSVVAESDKRRELGAPASLAYQVVEGIPQVIVATYGTRELLGVHAGTGKILWRYPYPADIILGLISTPVAVGSRLFVCGNEGKDKEFSVCLRMKPKDGGIVCEEIYRSTELQTNNFNTVAVFQDAVFGFGGGETRGFLHATDFNDGRLLWKVEGDDWTRNQQLVIADGLLFAITRKDELVLAEASREGYKELGRVAAGIELGRPQQPTIANGRLYLRGDDSVVCFRIAE